MQAHTMWNLVMGMLMGALLFGGCVGIGGETIRLSHEDLGNPPRHYAETMHVKSPATDLRTERDRIGRATMTVFAITSGSVTTEGPVGEEVAREVQLALTAGGYQVQLARDDTTAQNSDLVVKVAIKQFWFKNYNWLWPIVPTWGDVEMGLTVENATGQRLFEHSFTGSGNSMCLGGHCAFENATKKAMTAVVQQIRDAVMSEEFRRSVEAIDNKPRAEAWSGNGGLASNQQLILQMVVNREQ